MGGVGGDPLGGVGGGRRLMERHCTQSWANPHPLVKSKGGKGDIQFSHAVDLANPDWNMQSLRDRRFS